MTIIEAIKSRSRDKGMSITRRAWGYPHGLPGPAIKLTPTDPPDGFVVISACTSATRPGWEPRTEDILADDWTITF